MKGILMGLILLSSITTAPTEYMVEMEYYNDIPSVAGVGVFYDGDTCYYSVEDITLENEHRYIVVLNDQGTADKNDDTIILYWEK